eukprot:TRINITY_DN93256_c0_g1_i1.p1 TRINITY_DN93256_c0_g1~~TRINITY_DN93256_c0_g1_i1.p1  ORF type:complete len:185 (-),score=8.66 TRINITY_DN93256_c0_g1_i1:4-558(-)
MSPCQWSRISGSWTTKSLLRKSEALSFLTPSPADAFATPMGNCGDTAALSFLTPALVDFVAMPMVNCSDSASCLALLLVQVASSCSRAGIISVATLRRAGAAWSDQLMGSHLLQNSLNQIAPMQGCRIHADRWHPIAELGQCLAAESVLSGMPSGILRFIGCPRQAKTTSDACVGHNADLNAYT